MTAVVDFGKYELTARLARGGMAETYRAQLKGAAGVTKQVVIKKVLPDYADDKDFVEAFINEAKVSATLSHGNIAQVFDFGEIDGDYFIAMELVDGRSLVEVIFRAAEKGFPTLPEPIATFITIEVLKGLHYAHTKVGDDGKPLNIVHRDISPENVLVAFNGSTKVVDFGVAKAALQGRRETEPGKVKGKFQYLSPEQARGEPLDGRSDVFAVGIILYRMLCGVMPFEGQMHLVMRAIADGNFVPPQVQNPALPPTLAAIIAKSMATDRKDRYASALQMQEALVRNLYREEPTFSEEAIKEWMAWLFRPELEAEGRARVLSKRFETQLAKWDPHGPKAATSQAIRKVKPARPSRAPLWFAGAGLLLAAAIGAALLLKPGPVVVVTPPPVAGVDADEVVYPSPIHVVATKHRLKLRKDLPTMTFPGDADGPIVEQQKKLAHSPLFAIARDAAGMERLGVVRVRGTTGLGPYRSVRFFDFSPFDLDEDPPNRIVGAGGDSMGRGAQEFRVGPGAGKWARVTNVKGPLRMTLTPDDPKAWAARGRPAHVLVAWQPSGPRTWEADRAVLIDGAPVDVGDATELAFAFVELTGPLGPADSVVVAFEPLAARPQPPPDAPPKDDPAPDVLARAQAAFDQQDFATARKRSEECVAETPARADCHFVLAEACAASKDRACAVKHYRAARFNAGPDAMTGQAAAAKLQMLGEKP